MFTDLVRKIESYLEEISQCANSADWDFAQSERLTMQEEDIAYHLEIYPYVVSDLFNDILSVKTDMIETEDGTLLNDMESSTEELICLLKEYECMPSVSQNDEYNLSDYTWNPSNEDAFMHEYQEYLDKSFVSESKLRITADIERANLIYQSIKNAPGLITREKILNDFPHTSTRALNMALGREDVLSYGAVYTTADKLQIGSLAKANMLHSLSTLARDRTQHNVSELFDYAKSHNCDFLQDAKISNAYQFFSVVAYFFADVFSFTRPYFAQKGVQIMTAEDQLRKYLATSKNYSIRALLDYAKTKKITVDNIVRILTAFNDRYYILNKERIIPIVETGITESCKRHLAHMLSKELLRWRCVAIRDLETFASLPQINVQWTEWLVYSVLVQMDIPTITVTLSSNRFKEAIPVVAMIGEDTAENIQKATIKHSDTDSISSGVDNLEDLDLLLEDIIDFNVLGDRL